MNVDKNAQKIINKLREHGFEAYVVGGCVRDSIMETCPKDWDICTNALPENVQSVFKDVPVLLTGEKHGTVTVMYDNTGYEVTTYRLDGDYTDGRHPKSVKFVNSLKQDLSRRDFTINAIAYDNTFVDPFNGREDIKNKVIRCVGKASERFAEDKLRILRGIRFACRLGFTIETGTLNSMKLYSKDVRSIVSAERIQSELVKILEGKHMVAVLSDDKIADVFLDVFPELRPMWKFDQKNPHHCFTAYEHTLRVVSQADSSVGRLASLFHDIGKPSVAVLKDGVRRFYGHPEVSETIARAFMESLRFSNAEIKNVCNIVQYHEKIDKLNKKGLLRLINKLGIKTVQTLLEFRMWDIMAQSDYMREEKISQLVQVREVFNEIISNPNSATGIATLNINGNDLKTLGFTPGPIFKKILEKLLEEVQSEKLQNTREELMSRASELKIWET